MKGFSVEVHVSTRDELLEKALRERVRGEVRFDKTSRMLYSTDASNYKIEPIGVLIPRDLEDVHAAVEIAAENGIALLPRGAGTSLSGQTVGQALVIDFSKYMNRILEIDADRRIARVQPGLTLAVLNEAARSYGLTFGPDPASASRCTFGGMIGNNSCGGHSLIYGKTSDHTISIICITSDGHTVELGPEVMHQGSAKSREIALAVWEIVERNRELILSRYPDIPRCVSGYNFGELARRLDSSRSNPQGRDNQKDETHAKAGEKSISLSCLDAFNTARIIAGSEGTLAVVTEAVMNLVPLPEHDGAALVCFADRSASLDAVPMILELSPRAVEMVDGHLITAARNAPAYARKAAAIPLGTEGMLTVEFGGESEEEVAEAFERLKKLAPALPMAPEVKILTPIEREEIAGTIRSAALGLTGRVVGDAKPVGFMEDTDVPPARLGEYVRRYEQIAAKYGTSITMYGHAGQGCLHIKPTLNLKTREGIATMRAIAEEVADLVIEFGGSISGEHGDGLARSEFLPRMFGPEIMELHRRLKKLFDPAGLMNPGKIVDPQPMDQNLRYGPEYRTADPPTYFDFSEFQGFHRAVELCNGLGECRKLTSGTMCPSYMVTLDEMHTTRGRANAIRQALAGDLEESRVLEVLDLCLECKACKSECPISVDMARFKPEFLAHQHQVHGTPIQDRIFGMIHMYAALGTIAPRLWNLLIAGPISGFIKRISHIHPDRKLPSLARENFRRWFRRRGGTSNPEGRPVLLFDDTFNGYFDPEPLKAAVEVLERAGCRVMLSDEPVCCGRALISRGMLKQARDVQQKLVRMLAPFAERGIIIVGLEPGCLLTLRDELPDLTRDPRSRIIAERSMLLEEFLVNEASNFRPGRLHAKAVVHGHCHQKALSDMTVIDRLLGAIDGLRYEILNSGCCGMAGSFGYDRNKYEISKAIGERVLFPAIRALAPDDLVVADGFSCRTQIADFCNGREVIHMAQLLRNAMI